MSARIAVMGRFLLLLVALPGTAFAAETPDLEQPPQSAKARQLREEALALWTPIQPLYENLRKKKTPEPAEVEAALPAVEKAIELFERSLREEWLNEANRTLAEAARAWCLLREAAPPATPPLDEAARKKEEQAAERARRARVQELRRFVMEYGRERRADSLFRRCPKCEGRKEIVSPFGGRTDCSACMKHGILVDREGLIAARWLRHSPLYRSEARHERAMNQLLRKRPPGESDDPFAPYVRSVQIKDVEDHDTWARVKAIEQTQATYGTQKTEKAEVTYTLFRVAGVWYLHDDVSDRPLLDLTPKEK
jgi:hypothetical protein